MEDRIMFEIYRDPSGVHRVIYYTELDEESRNREIERAMHGDHVFDGYIAISKSSGGKAEVGKLVAELGSGAKLTVDQITARLKPYLIS